MKGLTRYKDVRLSDSLLLETAGRGLVGGLRAGEVSLRTPAMNTRLDAGLVTAHLTPGLSATIFGTPQGLAGRRGVSGPNRPAGTVPARGLFGGLMAYLGEMARNVVLIPAQIFASSEAVVTWDRGGGDDVVIGDVELLAGLFEKGGRLETIDHINRAIGKNLATKGRDVVIDGQKARLFANKKRNKEAMVRVVYDNVSAVIKIFTRKDNNRPSLTLFGVMDNNTLTIDVEKLTQKEIVSALTKISRFFELRNGVHIFRFDIGQMPLETMLRYAVTNRGSDRLRVVREGTRTFVCLVNMNWNGYKRSSEEVKEALLFEEKFGTSLQASISHERDGRGLDIRIYTTDRLVLKDLHKNRTAVVRQVEEVRTSLAHLLPMDDGEIIRVGLNFVPLPDRGEPRAYYLLNSFESKPERYADYNFFDAERGELVFLRMGDPGNGAYRIDAEKGLSLDKDVVTSELRHWINDRIWDGNKKEEAAKAGVGLQMAVAEFIDDLNRIHEPPRRYLTTRELDWSTGDWAVIEWATPFKSGHPYVTSTIRFLKNLILERGVYSLERGGDILRAIDAELVRFFLEVPLRPRSPLFKLALRLAEQEVGGRGEDESDGREGLVAIGKEYLSLYRFLEKANKGEFRTNFSVRRYKAELLLKKLVGPLFRVRELLLDSPLAYVAPNGKKYATQLEYMLDRHVLAELVDKTIASLSGSQ